MNTVKHNHFLCQGLLFIFIIVMFERLKIVVEFFHKAGECVVAMPLLLLQPVWTFIILIAFFVYWLAVMALIGTSDEVVPVNETALIRIRYEKLPWTQYATWYHLVALIWISEFIVAAQQYIISESVVKWYFTK